MKRLIFAAIATCILATPSSARETLDRSAVKKLIVDRPFFFVGASGGRQVTGYVQYTAGHRVLLKTSLGKEVGQWHLNGHKMCTQLPSRNNKTTCFAFEHSGVPNGVYLTSHGFRLVER